METIRWRIISTQVTQTGSHVWQIFIAHTQTNFSLDKYRTQKKCVPGFWKLLLTRQNFPMFVDDKYLLERTHIFMIIIIFPLSVQWCRCDPARTSLFISANVIKINLYSNIKNAKFQHRRKPSKSAIKKIFAISRLPWEPNCSIDDLASSIFTDSCFPCSRVSGPRPSPTDCGIKKKKKRKLPPTIRSVKYREILENKLMTSASKFVVSPRFITIWHDKRSHCTRDNMTLGNLFIARSLYELPEPLTILTRIKKSHVRDYSIKLPWISYHRRETEGSD